MINRGSIVNNQIMNNGNNNIKGSASRYDASNQGSKLNTLEKGQVIKGTIVHIKDNKVKVALEDGKILSGKLVDISDMNIGSQAYFRVEESSGKTILLKRLPNQEIEEDPLLNQQNLINKVLDSTGLLNNARNREIVLELLKHQMSIDKDTISFFIRQSHVQKNISIETLVQMSKLKVPLEYENSIKFESLLNQNNTMISNIQHMVDEIINLGTDKENLSFSQLLQTNGVLMNSALSNSETILGNVTPITGIPFLQNLDQIITKLSNSNLDSIMKSPEFQLLGNLQGEIKSFIQSYNSISNQHSNTAGNYYNYDTGTTKPYNIQVLTSQLLDGLEGLFHMLTKELEASPSAFSQNSPFMNAAVMDLKNSITNFIHSGAYKNFLKEVFLNKYLAAPDMLKQELSIGNYFNNLNTDLEQLEDLFKMIKEETSISFNQNPEIVNSTSFSNITGEMNQVKDSIQFMANLNKYFPFVQIPIKHPNYNTKGELYVYGNKKGKNNLSTDNIKVLLHLDMEHLGSLDIQVLLKNKNLNVKFYLQNEEILKLIHTHQNILEENLEEIGFHTKTEIVIKEEKRNILKEMLGNEKDSDKIFSYNFDRKA